MEDNLLPRLHCHMLRNSYTLFTLITITSTSGCRRMICQRSVFISLWHCDYDTTTVQHYMICNENVNSIPTIHWVSQFNLELNLTTKKRSRNVPWSFWCPWNEISITMAIFKLEYPWWYFQIRPPALPSPSTQLRAAGHVEYFEKIVVTK